MIRVDPQQLLTLISDKLQRAGLQVLHAETVAASLVHADKRGVHSHGALRTEYYVERICKGGINTTPEFTVRHELPSVMIFDGDNGPGHFAAQQAMERGIEIAQQQGLCAVGIRRISHSGALSFFVEQAAKSGMVALSLCQSDPMVVPYGGAEPYYGTNPIAFAAPGEDDDYMMLDMATSVQAWGKILDARLRHQPIPADWAVDSRGQPTTDPAAVAGLNAISGPKGYGLMMMVDVLAGMLLGLPFGKHVSSMYQNMSEGRNLGQLHIIFNPAAFTDSTVFRASVSRSMAELKASKPAQGVEQVLYPGEDCILREALAAVEGVAVNEDVWRYLHSDTLHSDRYETGNPFNGR